jgi:hypothetical protein
MRLIPRNLLALIIIGSVAGLFVISTAAGAQHDCGKAGKQVIEGPEPKNWDSLYRLFKRFGACDDGAIGEGFSEDVAQLFVKQWTHLDTLSRITASDKIFEQFVLRHIDPTLSNDELNSIENNSRLHCPKGQKRLCKLVQSRVQSSFEELHNYSK